MTFMPVLTTMWVLAATAAVGLLAVLAFLPTHEK